MPEFSISDKGHEHVPSLRPLCIPAYYFVRCSSRARLRGEQVVEGGNCLDGMLTLLVAILLVAIMGLRMYPELVGGLVRLAAMGFGEVVERRALPPSARFNPGLPSHLNRFYLPPTAIRNVSIQCRDTQSCFLIASIRFFIDVR
jgi:hypothetical protein